MLLCTYLLAAYAQAWSALRARSLPRPIRVRTHGRTSNSPLKIINLIRYTYMHINLIRDTTVKSRKHAPSITYD